MINKIKILKKIQGTHLFLICAGMINRNIWNRCRYLYESRFG